MLSWRMTSSDEEDREGRGEAQPVQDERRRLLELIGKVAWDRSFDHKAERSRARVKAGAVESAPSQE